VNPEDRLIVALDVDTVGQCAALVERLEGLVGHFKIGSQLFTAAGPAAVDAVQKRGGRVFLDLKFHDIPNTVAAAAREAAALGVFMLNVHASGGVAMMRAAADAVAASPGRPLAIAVTVLTSLDRHTLATQMGIVSSVEGHVLSLARLARDAGLDGVVASPNEIRAIRGQMGPGFVVVTPGVRPAGAAADDQARTATPGAAVQAGAHYLVVGRPITAATDPAAAARAILAEMRA
jgi:orotidine-5'-phosphate decarboxylase